MNMIIANLNELSVEDLGIFSNTLNVTFEINDGAIVGTERNGVKNEI